MIEFFNLPNLLSSLRIITSFFTIIAFSFGIISIPVVLVIIALGIVLDVGNGWLAKLLNQQTFAGKILDSLGDFLCFGLLTGILISQKAGVLLGLIYIAANFIREARILRLKGVKLKGIPNTFIAFLVVTFALMGVNNYLFWLVFSILCFFFLSVNIKVPLMHLRLYNLLRIKI